MRSHFPVMLDKPATSKIIAGISYFLFAYYLFPYMGVLFAQDESQQLYGAWIDIVYHLCNFAAAILIFFPYLKESTLNVQVYKKLFWATVGICTAAVVVLKIAVFAISYLFGSDLFFEMAYGTLLTTEMDMELLSTALLVEQPVWATLVLALACPFTVSCLLYGCVFSPVAYNRPWLGYVIMAVVLLLLRLLMIFCRWSGDQQLLAFLLTLPVHMLACLAYHITDTVWAPIAIHIFSNSAIALLTHLLITPLV